MTHVEGISAIPSTPAISGKHSSKGTGIWAESAEQWAVRANAPQDTAVFATSDKGIGIHAQSAEKWAVRAEAPQDTAVYATTNTGFAAVHAAGGTYAGYFDGVVRVTNDIQIDNGEVALSGLNALSDSNTTSGGLQMRLGVGRCGSYSWSGSAEKYVVETSSQGNPFPIAKDLENGDLVIGWNASQGQGETSLYSFRKDGWCGGFGFWCNKPDFGSDDYYLFRICEMRGAFLTSSGEYRGAAVYAQEFRSLSDARLKADTHKLEGCLEKLGRINGKSFKWRHLGSNSARDFGLEAQEVRTVFPELVSGEDNNQENEPLSVNYNGFIPVIVEALKEVTTRLQAMEDLHSQMQARLKELEQRPDSF